MVRPELETLGPALSAPTWEPVDEYITARIEEIKMECILSPNHESSLILKGMFRAFTEIKNLHTIIR